MRGHWTPGRTPYGPHKKWRLPCEQPADLIDAQVVAVAEDAQPVADFRLELSAVSHHADSVAEGDVTAQVRHWSGKAWSAAAANCGSHLKAELVAKLAERLARRTLPHNGPQPAYWRSSCVFELPGAVRDEDLR